MTCSNTISYKPFSHLTRPREVIRQFTPNWFAATMGTGVLALALAQLPVQLPGVYAIAEGLWLLTIFLFVLFSGLYAARWVMFYDEARRIFGIHGLDVFRQYPMGATIITACDVGPAALGARRGAIGRSLWWLDVAMGLACGV